MHIGLTYDLQTDPSDERQAEFDPPSTIQALRKALQSLGHDVVLLGGALDLLKDRRNLLSVDLVLNIAEGSYGRCREAWVPMLLELWGIPFVGSGSAAQALSLDKLMSKRIARASGLATPNWFVLDSFDSIRHAGLLRFPLIVKPRYEGSGVGIDTCAVVHDIASLNRRVEWVIKRFHQPCLIEDFIAHGELTVFLIGNNPPKSLPAIQRLLDPQTRLSCHVSRKPAQNAWLSPVELTPSLDCAARNIAVAIFEAIGCNDMARVDLRVDEQGNLYFLEINPLPSFDPEGSLGLLAEYLGKTYTDMVALILDAALHRVRDSGFTRLIPNSEFRIPNYE